MSAGIPPPPLNSPSGSYYWLEWYTSLTNVLNGTGYPWTALNFGSSNLHDIQTRHHNSLQNIQGGNTIGDLTGTGNAWHMSGRGYCDASGVATGMPTGWSMVHTGTGVFTLTHNLGLAAPNVGATATSNTTSVVVQYIDVTVSNTVVFHLTNPSGTTPTDGAFTFLVTS
jgi:hypothetical protein